MGKGAGLYRVMAFVDATNFLNGLAKTQGLVIDEGRPSLAAFRVAQYLVETAVLRSKPSTTTPHEKVRVYWVGSSHGADTNHEQYEEDARVCSFEPVLIRKKWNAEEKGVDMALALRMLTNAFHGNYDAAVLVAGDADYVDLVGEVKRYGPRVYCLAFDGYGVSPRLRRSVDGNFSCERFLENKGEFEAKLKDLASSHDPAGAKPSKANLSPNGAVKRLQMAKESGVTADIAEARKTLQELLAAETGDEVSITPRFA